MAWIRNSSSVLATSYCELDIISDFSSLFLPAKGMKKTGKKLETAIGWSQHQYKYNIPPTNGCSNKHATAMLEGSVLA
jgi:hypothetical protein